jgi:hypothetical protein
MTNYIKKLLSVTPTHPLPTLFQLQCGVSLLVSFTLNPSGHGLHDAQHQLLRLHRPYMAAVAFLPSDCTIPGSLPCPLVDSRTENGGDTSRQSKVGENYSNDQKIALHTGIC